MARRRLVAVAAYLIFVSALAGAAETPRAAEIEGGKTLYAVNCARCHGLDGTGDGPDAAPLEAHPPDFRRTNLLLTRSDEDLLARIRGDVSGLSPLRPMPSDVPDTDALYRFLRSMPSMPWPLVDGGRGRYLSRCSACHGFYGHGEGVAFGESMPRPRDLSTPEFQSGVTDDELEVLVRHGRAGMPALDPPVDPEEAKGLRRFVRMLSRGYELYYRYCVTCHGPHGRAGEEKSGDRPRVVFDERYFEKNPYPDPVRERIWHMLKGARPPMPHFEATLTADQIRAILAYLRSLPPLQ